MSSHRREYERIYGKAKQKAVAMFRAMHPDIWDRLLDEAYAESGVTRMPIGRPPKLMDHTPT